MLDDSKLLTLSNGERLYIEPEIKFVFELEHLNHATPATVSRCGMVYFSPLVVPLEDLLENKAEDLFSDDNKGAIQLHHFSSTKNKNE